MRRSCLLSFFILLGLVVAHRAVGDELALRAQSILDRERVERDAMGMTAAIWRDGALAWSGGSGLADRENNVAATPGMVHRIASISKPITAVAVMQLVEQKKIDLDAPIQRYVPYFPYSSLGTLQVRHLLSHTGGVRHWNPGGEANTTIEYPTLKAAIGQFVQDPLLFAPGEGYEYTTHGYMLLGAAVEQASGMPLLAYLRAHVWEPAGMTSTDFETFGKPLPNQAVGYVHVKGKAVVAKKTNLSSKYPGGGMVSTAEDLVRFAARLQDGTLIREETFEAMLVPPRLPAPKKTNYGLGFSVTKDDAYGRIVSHSGQIVGARTHLRIMRDHGISVAVISNTREGSVTEVAVALGKLAME